MKEMVDVTITIDAEVYKQATEVFREAGMTFEEAVLLFIHETVRLGRFPFELTEEDWEFVRSMEKAAAGET